MLSTNESANRHFPLRGPHPQGFRRRGARSIKDWLRIGAAALGMADAQALAAPAMPDWVEAYTREALAAPITLDNALKYRWYQIGAAIRAQHPMVYDIDIAPALQQLRRHGNAAVDDLKRQLDARFAVVPSLEAAGPATAQCTWILARDRGEGLTQLQIDLDTYCRDHAAPALYARLLRERADGLDIRLATLPSLSTEYPVRLVGTSGRVGREDVAAAYARALDQRLGKAELVVIAELGTVFSKKVLGEGALQNDAAQCRDLLGSWYPGDDALRNLAASDPLNNRTVADAPRRFARAVGAVCHREAKAWSLRQQPAITRAIQAAIAAVDVERGPILSVSARCSAILGRWFPAGVAFDPDLTGPLQATCRHEADGLNAKAVAARAATIAARIERAPRTLAGLEQNGWFEPTAADIQGATDPGDRDRGEVEASLKARTAAVVRPWREAAWESALAEIADGYIRSGLTDSALITARGRCAPYLALPGRPLPAGGEDLRAAVTAACRAQEGRIVARRVEAALAEAHINDVLGPGRLATSSPDGRPISLNPRAVVAAAAINGYQVRFQRTTSWGFQTRTTIAITPLGGVTPTLDGTLEPETRSDGVPIWRIAALRDLPGLDGPLATLACLTQGSQAALASLVSMFAGTFIGLAADAPYTAGALILDGTNGLLEVAACGDAKAAFLAAEATR